MTHAPYDLLRGFRTARFEWSGLPATAHRAAVIGTTTGKSSWRAVVRGAPGDIPSIRHPRSIPVLCPRSCPVSCLEFHRTITNVRVCRQRLGEPPATGVQGWHDVHRDGLLARPRSTPLHHDRRRWNEVRTA